VVVSEVRIDEHVNYILPRSEWKKNNLLWTC